LKRRGKPFKLALLLFLLLHIFNKNSQGNTKIQVDAFRIICLIVSSEMLGVSFSIAAKRLFRAKDSCIGGRECFTDFFACFDKPEVLLANWVELFVIGRKQFYLITATSHYYYTK